VAIPTDEPKLSDLITSFAVLTGPPAKVVASLPSLSRISTLALRGCAYGYVVILSSPSTFTVVASPEKAGLCPKANTMAPASIISTIFFIILHSFQIN